MNILSLINCDSIISIQDDLQHDLKRKLDIIGDTYSDTNTKKIKRQIKVLDLALRSNKQSRSTFNKAQISMTKQCAERYSQTQHNLMIRSTKFDKDFNTVDSISNNIDIDHVSDM